MLNIKYIIHSIIHIDTQRCRIFIMELIENQPSNFKQKKKWDLAVF